eukprot:GDKJ01001215.1.p1 GENE.GDKJ01001215.1~~GDKJ01001215.1.p1  ORF type:complete len:729 (+),score=200.47 GDKJ01001215.1:25-2187(+)
MGQDASLPTSSISDRKKGSTCLQNESILNALSAASAAGQTSIATAVANPWEIMGRPKFEDQYMRWFSFREKTKPYRGPLKPRYKFTWIDYLDDDDYKPVELAVESSDSESSKKEEVEAVKEDDMYTDSDDDVRGILLDDPRDPLRLAKTFKEQLGVPEEEIGAGLTDVAEEVLKQKGGSIRFADIDENDDMDAGDFEEDQDDAGDDDGDDNEEETEVVDEAIRRVSKKYQFDVPSVLDEEEGENDIDWPDEDADEFDNDADGADDETRKKTTGKNVKKTRNKTEDYYQNEDEDGYGGLLKKGNDDDSVGSTGSLRMNQLQANVNKQIRKKPLEATERLKKMLMADDRFMKEDTMDVIWDEMVDLNYRRDREREEAEELERFQNRAGLEFSDRNASTKGESALETKLDHLAVFMKQKKESMRSGEASTHPVAIVGSCVIGESLEFRDLSSMSRSFPIFSSQWVLSTDMSKDPVFPPSGQQSRSFRLLPHHLGRSVAVHCERTVEIEPQDEWDEPKRLVVKTSAQIGPVLVADSWAIFATKALSKGGLDIAVRIKDNPEIFNEFDDVNSDLVLERNEEELLAEVFRKDGTLSFRRGAVALEYTAEDASGNKDELEFEVQYDKIHCKPGMSSNAIVLVGKSRRNGLERAIRLQVDPSVGRDSALTCFLAFQGNRRINKGSSVLWKPLAESNNFHDVKLLITKQLQYINDQGRTLDPYDDLGRF